jgi:antitoxin VapB
VPTLNIKDEEVRRLAHQLATRTGQTMTEAVRQALREKLDREQARDRASRELVIQRVLERARATAARPLLDSRSADEIIGYDEYGVPK